MPPTRSEIYRHWAPWLAAHNREFSHIFCWACGHEFHTNKYDFTDLSPEEVAELWDRGKVLQICHIVPRALGGALSLDNLFLLCPDCHDLAPDTTSRDIFLSWVLGQSYAIRRMTETLDAIRTFGITSPEKIVKITDCLNDLEFQEWAYLHSGAHMLQNRSGVKVKMSTIIGLAVEYTQTLDTPKQEVEGTI